MARARTIHGLKPGGGVRTNARKIVAERADEFFGFAPYLTDPTRVTELHDMRIAAKRLRYALELFADALGPAAEGCIARIKEFQDLVGEIHDDDVFVGILRAHLAAIATERAALLADRAAHADAPDGDAALKAQCRALVTDDAWVAEQIAIAAAIARTSQTRRERHTTLITQWQAREADELHAQLGTLAAD